MSKNRIKKRIILDKAAKKFFSFSTVFALIVLVILIYRVFSQSIGWLNIRFLTNNLSISPDKAGIRGVLIGTTMLMAVVAPVTMILGVSTAVYLEEFSARGRLYSIIKTNISNLAGVPSVIFGLLGLTVFGRLFRLGSSIFAGGLTLSLLVLPIIVVASQEAIRAVPGFLRDTSYAIGATKWTTVRRIVLPAALPGIMTGSILSLSRAIGETAPLVVLGIPTLILRIPRTFTDDFTALPIQIYYWTLDSVLTKEYINLAAASIIVLLILLFLMNTAAIIVRNKFQKRY
jgi:phosphate transport system permease protein